MSKSLNPLKPVTYSSPFNMWPAAMDDRLVQMQCSLQPTFLSKISWCRICEHMVKQAFVSQNKSSGNISLKGFLMLALPAQNKQALVGEHVSYFITGTVFCLQEYGRALILIWSEHGRALSMVVGGVLTVALRGRKPSVNAHMCRSLFPVRVQKTPLIGARDFPGGHFTFANFLL